jgi:hypothetical protein
MGVMTEGARVTRADVPFVLLALVSGVALLYVGRSLTFYYDEWEFITFDGGLGDYLRPYNEHWSTFPLLLYRATFSVVGLRSYLPYLTEVIVLHVFAVGGAYAIARARVGPFMATLIAVPLLLLGSGSENLFWAFQTGFVGSVMFGVWALFFIERPDRRAPIIASGLLVASLASSGIGLFFLVAAIARTLVDGSLRWRVLAVAPPATLYLLWYALLGREAVGTTHPLVADLSALRFAVRGITFSTKAFFGLNLLPEAYLWGLLLFIGLAAVTGIRIIRRSRVPPSLALACLLGIASMYTLIALVRAHLDQDFSLTSRYVYVAAFFLALAVADLLPRWDSWPTFTSRTRIVGGVALGVGLLLSTVANVDALAAGRSAFQYQADITRAFIALATAHRDAPWVDQTASSNAMPPVFELVDILSRHGSPLEDELIPEVVYLPGKAPREHALLAIIGDRFGVRPATGRGAPVRLIPRSARGVTVARDGKCFRAWFVGEAPELTVATPGGVRVRLRSSSEVTGYVSLGHGPWPLRRIRLDLASGVTGDVAVPDVHDGRLWQVGLELTRARDSVSLCAMRPLLLVRDRSLRS